MDTTTELNPNIAKQILTDASQKGLSVEVYLKKIIDKDERLKAMRDAMKDKLFLADLEEIAEDFRHVDFE
ncbi:MAG: hypothetical protein LC768_05045 [Acidobacteria bacterium]|nr:hypothetical protein [Acidobacteriota bacterium]MCA1637693.1 hypothetical protein [Acidobacteriota bacterium]